ncbi:MAG: L-2-hydroxyglutarate oxidase [Candidatus Omnitrophica bacterium]|nr:L-2-hydroxyglutarate oxidase [Candidatus Omnitrophota bacterium]
MEKCDFDVVVIGGGIVGLATALAFIKQYRRYRIALVEKEAEVALHQTGHNSGVLHSGIYYAPDSLKAKLCVSGVQRLLQFAEENAIPYELCGKLILATRVEEVPLLKALWKRGVANGVPDLQLIDAIKIKELEPYARGLYGLYSPKTGIIDFRLVAQAMARHYVDQGGCLMVNRGVTKITSQSGRYHLFSDRESICARYVINCGGLFADRIAEMMGLKLKVRIVPIRGEYFMIRPERKFLVRNLIYPVPSQALPFLGVHLTRTLDGSLKAGPNAVLALAREGYRRAEVKLGDLLEMMADLRLWKMAKKYWKVGVFEAFRAINKSSFAALLRQFVPEMREEDLVPGPSGVRAQCIDENGTLINDFEIVEGPQAIHVLNVPSPAATASFSIADYIVNLAGRAFALQS